MTREDIIRMAREAGFIINDDNPATWSLERFAALVAAASEAKEREACAQAADDQWVKDPTVSGGVAIRARGQA